MEKIKKVIAETVFAVQILILFILVFESLIRVPPILQAFGRLHPMLLHLPIGLLLITTLLILSRRFFEGKATEEIISFLLHFTALTASFTTLMGLLLSLEGTFSADQMWLHKWLGVLLSFLCWGLLAVRTNAKVMKPMAAAGVVLLIFTGHFGATLTHGEGFLTGPLESEPDPVARVITDSSTLFYAAIDPILESKCYSCHNDRKAKGNLVLTSLESISRGGKNGDLWKPGDAAHSLIVERLSLPIDDKEHMPPKDKAQLTEDEKYLISLWIDAGADTGKKLNELEPEDTIKHLASAIIPRYQKASGVEQLYSFAFAPPETIRKLSIPNRTVFQIASNEPAVQADFYLRQTYDRKYLEELTTIREQLIALNLSNMPVEDQDLKTIAKFGNLEVLNLNNTGVKGPGLRDLTGLSNLRSLSLSGTSVSRDALSVLGESRSLRTVYLWNTAVTEEETASLEKAFPGIEWNIGYIHDEAEILKLNVPMLKNDSRVLGRDEDLVLRHNLPGTIVRYTVDNSEPDSVNSPVYDAPVAIRDYTIVRTKAYKDGWLSSDVADYVVFKKGHKPASIELLTPPDERYPGEGGITLMDEQKGLPDFYRAPAWMAVRKNDLVALISFGDQAPEIRKVTLSYAKNIGAMCMPPASMELWGGDDPKKLSLLAKTAPPQPTGYEPTRIEGATLSLPGVRHRYYKLVARPLARLPDFRKAKKEDKAWLMVDEIFFN